jgi:hypothetical protein
MNKTLAIALITLIPSLTFAEGSKISASTISNNANNQQTVNSATGEGATALTGGVRIMGSEVSAGSSIVNQANNAQTKNIADGKGAEAQTGQIDIGK